MPSLTIFWPPPEVVAQWPNSTAIDSNGVHHRVPDWSRNIPILVLPPLVIAIIFVALRLYVRVKKNNMGVDDILIVLAMIPMAAGVIMACILKDYGLGMHIWDALALGKAGRWRSQDARFLIWLRTLLLSISHILARASVLMLLYRMFNNPGERFMRYALHACCAFLVTTSVVIIMADTLQCLPVQAFWVVHARGADCPHQRPLQVVGKLFNCLGNIILFILPLHRLWQTRLPMGQRIGLVVSFGIGLIVCVLSVVKMVYLGRFLYQNPLYDTTWYHFPVAVICSWENSFTIVCACMPMLGYFFNRKLKNAIPPKSPGANSWRSSISFFHVHTRSSWRPKYWLSRLSSKSTSSASGHGTGKTDSNNEWSLLSPRSPALPPPWRNETTPPEKAYLPAVKETEVLPGQAV